MRSSMPKLSNVNNPPRMRSALLPNGMVFRMAEGVLCPYCGHPVANYPKPLGSSGSFALICLECHQDVFICEPQS
jgi:hypothetical protein